MNREEAVELLLSIASTDLHKTEVGSNRGEWIAKLWLATNYPEGYSQQAPYCAAGMCWVWATFFELLRNQGELQSVMKMTGAQTEEWRCKSAAAWGWRDWAEQRGLKRYLDTIIPKAGDVVVYDFHHVGLVTGAAGKHDMMTLEYNTNANGSREGDGCWEKSRPISLAQCFIRIIPE
jgi:hypothetical protein